jgi:PAS domain-containing protein/CheY-like chemotaxis protein
LVPDFIRNHGAMLKQVIETGQPELNVEVKSQMPSRPGEITYWRASYFPIPLPEGKRGIGIIGVEITDIKKVEEALQQRTEELQTILDTTPVGIFIAHDPECRKITGNRAGQKLVELPPDANISKSAPPDERPTHWQEMHDGLPIESDKLPLQRAARGEEIRNYEMDLVYEDGTVKSVVGNATPIRNENGEPRGGVAILMDITQRKQAEENLRRGKEELEARIQERTKELALRASQLRALAGEITISEQRERKRLASLLHDHLQQLLVGAKFRLSVLRRTGDEEAKLVAREIENIVDESIQTSRSLTAELSPPILHDAGLNAGLEWLGRRIADTQGLFVDLITEQLGSLLRQGIANLLNDEEDIEVVGTAADGQEAANLAIRLMPDVILMDMSMPKLNGVEATRLIHNDHEDIRIIELSMFEEAEKAQAMRDAGCGSRELPQQERTGGGTDQRLKNGCGMRPKNSFRQSLTLTGDLFIRVHLRSPCIPRP